MYHFQKVSLINRFFCILGFVLCTSIQAHTVMNLFNQRYCEVIIGYSPVKLKVYNTIGLNNCPENSWKQLTESSVKKENKAFFVRLNGPRYWLINGMKQATLVNRNEKKFGDIGMRIAGIIHLSLIETMHGSKPYYEHHVKRKTVWIYQKGTRVYELIDPKGNVYVMQSYSIQNHPQTLSSLITLQSRLNLPSGWKFKSGVITTDQELPAIRNEAVVVQDDFMNTYQLSLHDFLA